MLNKVKLANGTEVDWEEFSLWTTRKQNMNLISHKQSEESRKKLSIAGKGKVISEETREKLRNANLGKIVTEETRKKISKSSKGKVISEQTRKKLRDANVGKLVTEETRKKLSTAGKGRMPWNKGLQFIEFCEIYTPNGIFRHINAVAYYAKRNHTTVRRWMTKWPNHYYFIEKTR